MAGAGYKLFNTGDVLTAAQVNTYLMEQTVMVFADAAARTTALTGVVSEGMLSYLKDTNAVEVYNGSAWVSLAANQTPLTTKGDLFTFSTVDARLAVGNNGETLVADSSATTGLRYQEPKAGNPVINSAFQIWQRGTSIAATTTAYSADRWQAYRSTTGATVSRQVTNDTTNLPNIQYCARVQRDSGNTNTSQIYIAQSFESVNSIPFAGKAITLSFYARAGANYSSASSALALQLSTGTGTDQNVMTGFTGSANPISTSVTLTTTWQRFSVTGTISTTATQIGMLFNFTPVGTAGAADFFEITGVQLEVGSVATPFKTQGVTLAGELAACQRYYYRLTPGAVNKSFGVASASSTTSGTCFTYFPVEMRIIPTALEQSGTANEYALNFAGVTTTCSAVPALGGSISQRVGATTFTVASGLTGGQAGRFQTDSTNGLNAFLGWSAEL